MGTDADNEGANHGRGVTGEAAELAARPREEAREAYNRLSRIYDFLTSGAEERVKNQGIDLLEPSSGESILEIGCGTGKGLLKIAEETGKEGHVSGIDISEGMLDIASKRISESGFSGNISVIRGDAVKLPYGDETFDAVFMSFTLELFSLEDMAKVLEECRRVLKPGGRIGIVSMSKRGEETMMRKAYLWAHIRFPKYVDCRPIYAEKTLADSGFDILGSRLEKIYGLPVEIVTGVKRNPEKNEA